MKTLCLLAVLAYFTACTPLHSGNPGVSVEASSAPVTQAQLASFQTTIYAFGQSQGCVKCHGESVNPLWMNADISTAYSFAAPFVDFNNPTASIFAANAGNNHCNDPVCAVPENVAVVQDLLLQWSTVELAQQTMGSVDDGGGSTLATPPFVTAAVAVPSPLPLVTAGTPAVIRFDLSMLTPPVPALANAILELSIQSYNSAGTTYKIFNPRLVGGTAPVAISGLHIYVRAASDTGLGVEDVNQGTLWSDVDITALAIAKPTPLPNGPMTSITPLVKTSLGVSAQSAADVITVGFLKLAD